MRPGDQAIEKGRGSETEFHPYVLLGEVAEKGSGSGKKDGLEK